MHHVPFYLSKEIYLQGQPCNMPHIYLITVYEGKTFYLNKHYIYYAVIVHNRDIIIVRTENI